MLPSPPAGSAERGAQATFAIDLGTALKLGPCAREALVLSVGTGPRHQVREALHRALRCREERIAFAADLRTHEGLAHTLLVGRPAYQLLDEARADLSPEQLSILPPHYPMYLEAGTGAYARGEHLVVLLSREERGVNARLGPAVSFELLDVWTQRLRHGLPMLRPSLDPELGAVADGLLVQPAHLEQSVTRSIISHELGHHSDAWPIWPTEPADIRSIRAGGQMLSDDMVRVRCNALGDIAADVFGPCSGQSSIQLLILAYQWMNLRECQCHDADAIGAFIIWRALSDCTFNFQQPIGQNAIERAFDNLRRFVCTSRAAGLEAFVCTSIWHHSTPEEWSHRIASTERLSQPPLALQATLRPWLDAFSTIKHQAT